MKTFKSLKNSHSQYNNKYLQNEKNSSNNSEINKIILKYKSENLNNTLKKNSNKKNSKFKNENKQLEIEKKIFKIFKDTYSNDKDFYNIKIINEIICNDSTHIVAEFKDYLINGDYSEFLQKLYSIEESKECLPKIFEYYDSCSVIFPNYVILPESKYIYKNIQRKQRVIDQQQELEEEKERKLNEEIIDYDINDIIFNDNAIDSILNQTDTSGVKKFFGLNNDNDCSTTFTMDNVVKMIDNAEKEVKLNFDKKKNLHKIKSKNKIPKQNNNNNIKGRNHKRFLNSELSNMNTMKNNNSILNKNNFLSTNTNRHFSQKSNNINNNSNHKKISSTIFYMDQKYNNNTIYISSPTHTKNNKPLIRNSFIPNNQNNIPIKTNEKNLINKNKITKTKTFSPTNKSLLNNNKKILSSSSSISENLIITSYHDRKLSSFSKIKHKKIKSQYSINSVKQIPLTSREKQSINPKIMKMIGAKIQKSKNLSINRKSSMSSSSNKKTFFTSTSNTCSYNNKSNNHSKKKKSNIQDNNKYISVTHRNYRPPLSINNNTNNTNNTTTKTNTNISKNEKLNIDNNDINEIITPIKSNDFQKFLNTYEHYPSKNIVNEENYILDNHIKKKHKKIISNNSILPNQKNLSIKGIQIKGFEDIIKRSRNTNSISERFPSSNSIKSKTNRNSTFSNKNYVEIYQTIKKK